MIFSFLFNFYKGFPLVGLKFGLPNIIAGEAKVNKKSLAVSKKYQVTH